MTCKSATPTSETCSESHSGASVPAGFWADEMKVSHDENPVRYSISLTPREECCRFLGDKDSEIGTL